MLLMVLHGSNILIWLPGECAVFSHCREAAELCSLAIVWEVLMCMHSFVLVCWLNERNIDQLEQMCTCECMCACGFIWMQNPTITPRFILYWQTAQYIFSFSTDCLGMKSVSSKLTQRKQICIKAKIVLHTMTSECLNGILNLVVCAFMQVNVPVCCC